MSQYKVPQNVEAEDKILGPLTIKQFIYAIIGVAWFGLMFAIFKNFLPLVFLLASPVTLLFLLLAFYQHDGQNFEQLLIAMVGYFSQSRKRLWRKEEIIESLHITPRAAVIEQTQRNPVEVKSELERLGSMIDSRGWNASSQNDPAVVNPISSLGSDRIIAPPQPSISKAFAETPAQDMLDTNQSQQAQNVASLVDQAAADARQLAIAQMMANANSAAIDTTTSQISPADPVSTSVTTPQSADILELATNRDDLTITQLAATATRNAILSEGQAVELRNNG